MAVIDLRGDHPLRDLTASLVADIGRTDTDKPFGIYYVGGESDYAVLGRAVEREVFRSWFGNDDDVMDREYNGFDSTSDFVICIDHEQSEPAGVIRVIHPSEVGLKTFIDLEAEPRWGVSPQTVIEHHPCSTGLEGVHDVATLAVRPGWSGGAGMHVSHALYCGLYRWSVTVGAEQLVCMLDTKPYELLCSLGIRALPLCGLEPLEYLGSPSTQPVMINVVEVVADMRTDTALRELLGGKAAMDSYSMPTVTLRDGIAEVEGIPLDRVRPFADPIQL